VLPNLAGYSASWKCVARYEADVTSLEKWAITKR
jgi:hypothetical protein